MHGKFAAAKVSTFVVSDFCVVWDFDCQRLCITPQDRVKPRLHCLEREKAVTVAVAIATCLRYPRNVRRIMASVITMFMVRSKNFSQNVASVTIACSWTRSMHCSAFHRTNAMLTSSCAWVFSCDLIFTATFFGFPDTLLVHPLCPAVRERDPSGCRASGLTSELPVHVVLVTPLLVLPLLRLHALVCLPGVQRQPHRHFYFIDFPRKCLVPARCGGFEKPMDFTRAGYRIVQSTLLLSFFCSTGSIQTRTFIRRIHRS